MRAFYIFLIVLKKFHSVLVSLWYEKCISYILIASIVKSTVFKPQTASRTPLHFVICGFNLGKQENCLKVSASSLTEEMSLRKKVESSI